MVVVSVENQQKKLPINPRATSQIAKIILRREKVKKASVAFVFVTSAAIRALNKKYLSRQYATDVLAFNLSEPESKELIGDVIISTDAVIENAATFGTTHARELTLYIIHGLLHLIGYDDHRKADIKKMRAKELEFLKLIGPRHAAILKP